MLCIRGVGIAQMQALLRLMSDNQNFEQADPAPRPHLRPIAGHARSAADTGDRRACALDVQRQVQQALITTLPGHANADLAKICQNT